MVQIKFITFGATSAGGSFAPGDVLRCSAEMAKHLVEEAQCAKYVDAQPAPAKAEEAPKRGRKAK